MVVCFQTSSNKLQTGYGTSNNVAVEGPVNAHRSISERGRKRLVNRRVSNVLRPVLSQMVARWTRFRSVCRWTKSVDPFVHYDESYVQKSVVYCFMQNECYFCSLLFEKWKHIWKLRSHNSREKLPNACLSGKRLWQQYLFWKNFKTIQPTDHFNLVDECFVCLLIAKHLKLLANWEYEMLMTDFRVHHSIES